MVLVGRVSGVSGLRGWLKIVSYTEPRENILAYVPWYMQPTGEPERLHAEHPLCIAEGRAQNKALLARLEGCDDRDAAVRWVGAGIAVARSEFPASSEGEYYWSDLVGLRVITLEGINLGKVDRLIETGANDVLVITGDRERLIPYIRNDVVRNIDSVQGTISVDWDPEF